MHASLHLHTCSLSTHGFVCSLIVLASEQHGCYLNSRFINRPVYCCSRQRELTHLLTCTKKRSETRTHFASCCQIHWSTFTEGCLCPTPHCCLVPSSSSSFYCLLLPPSLPHSPSLPLSLYYFSFPAPG